MDLLRSAALVSDPVIRKSVECLAFPPLTITTPEGQGMEKHYIPLCDSWSPDGSDFRAGRLTGSLANPKFRLRPEAVEIRARAVHKRALIRALSVLNGGCNFRHSPCELPLKSPGQPGFCRF